MLADNFNGLVPDRPAARGPAGGASGWLAAAMLGDVAAFHVAGDGQVLRRSATLARRQPSDLLKVCIQRSGSATIQQDGREVLLGPGSMAIYDIDKPYAIRLQGDWRCAVIAFPRTALAASRRFIDDVICRPAQAGSGPGSVLVPLVASAVTRPAGAGDAGAGALMGRASIADAHHMSGRTLHRLFGGPGPTVTELIRGYRLDRVHADLLSPACAGLAISRVAARWGLFDMPHFSRAFRARYGMTPSQARQQVTGQPG